MLLEGHFLLTYAGIVMNNSRLMKRCEGSAEGLLVRSRSVPFYEWAAWIRAQLRDLGKPDTGCESEEDDDLRLGGGLASEYEMRIVMGAMGGGVVQGLEKATPRSNMSARSWLSPFRSKSSANPSESGDWGSSQRSLSGASVVEPLQGLCQRLLLNNTTLAAKLKAANQRRKAIELALEMEQMDREEETQRADAVKRVVDLLSEQVSSREEEISSLRRQLGSAPAHPPAHHTNSSSFDKKKIAPQDPSPRELRPQNIAFDTQYDNRRGR